ncbi:hypothetical protein I7I48_02569 [Histoplasma ohiense]|nr:hypothetical protein I7I48_02569 [Histoplasma ohiense (nom. inval.)]
MGNHGDGGFRAFDTIIIHPVCLLFFSATENNRRKGTWSPWMVKHPIKIGTAKDQCHSSSSHSASIQVAGGNELRVAATCTAHISSVSPAPWHGIIPCRRSIGHTSQVI